MSQLEKIVKLTKSQYESMMSASPRQISYTGGTHVYDENNLYVTTDETFSVEDLGNDFVLPVSKGGTGKTQFTVGSVLVGNGTAALTELAATDQSTANTLVKRNNSNGFSVGTITATTATLGSMSFSGNLITATNKITSNTNYMLLGYKQSGDGVTTSQWCVGASDCQGVIRTAANQDLLHSRGTTTSTIIDTGNYKTYTWARPSSITTGQVVISNGTDGTTALRGITNNTSIGPLGWVSGNTTASNLQLVTVNTLAYWDGSFWSTDHASNLEYYKGGKFGTMAKETATDYAKLASPALTGTPTAPTAANGTNTTQIATTEFVNNTLAYVNAMQFKGTLGTGGTITALPALHDAGDTYRVITAGTWAGKYCEVGTLIICIKDGTAAADADWTSVETNEDGAIIGSTPSSSTDNAIVRWDGATGRIIQNSTVTINDNGSVYTERAGEIGYVAKNTTKAHQVEFIVGESGNGGVYDRTRTKWIVYSDISGNVILNGNANTSTTATNLANNPSIQTSGTTQVTITAGGKTSSAYTVPYATSAGSVAWENTGHPNTFPPSSHTHGNITNDGKMSGSTVSGNVATTHKFLREDGTWVVPAYTTNTNNAVTQNVSTANKKYGILLSAYETSASTTTATSVNRDSKVYVNPSLNQVAAGQLTIHDKASTPVEKVTLQWNSTDSALEFVFA